MNEQSFFPKKGEPIKKRLEEMRGTSGRDLSMEKEPQSVESLKREIYALAALLTETYHRQTMKTLRTDSETLVDEMQKMRRKNMLMGGSLVEHQQYISVMEGLGAVEKEESQKFPY